MYVFNTELNLPIEESVARLADALADEGLEIVSDTNVQVMMAVKLHEQFRPYRILGVWAPGLARSLIGADAAIGVLLPCNIVLQEREGRTQVSFMDPVVVLGLANQPAIQDLARQARDILGRVCTRVQN